jgi:hypothetical protein
MNKELEKKFWYITRHKGNCATCKYYKPDNEITGYDPWYQQNEVSAWYTGECQFNPIPVSKDAWKQKCGQYEEISEEDFLRNYGK